MALNPVAAAPKHVEYPLIAHVRESGKTGVYQYVIASIGGKWYRLTASAINHERLLEGDYPARLMKETHNRSYESGQTFEFSFPDKKTRKYKVESGWEANSFMPIKN
jgi:hypothetical protein